MYPLYVTSPPAKGPRIRDVTSRRMRAWTCVRSSCARSGRRSRTVDTMHGRAICTRIDDWVTHAAADRSRDVTHVPWLIAARASCIKDGGSHAKWGRSPPWSALPDARARHQFIHVSGRNRLHIGMCHRHEAPPASGGRRGLRRSCNAAQAARSML